MTVFREGSGVAPCIAGRSYGLSDSAFDKYPPTG